MLRMTVHTDDMAVTLQMEGRLAGPAIPEAERCWEAARVEHPDRPLRVDLRAVTFIDQEGIALLKQAFRQGASFLSSGCLTRAYVEEVIGSVRE
ncbi:MAG: hypothetical protein AB7T38_16440 [Nitrospirales bacterium]